MRRREFVSALGVGAVALPCVARAQSSAPVPVLGFLHSGAPEQNAARLARFRKGLADAGFVEGHNLTIEYRWARGDSRQLSELAASLIDKRAAVFVALSSTPAAMAAHAATKSIPIFFVIAEPPVELGLVESLSRPGGNATGIITMALELSAKRLELLRELTPEAPLAALFNRSHPGTKPVSAVLGARAEALGIPLRMEFADTDTEIEDAFEALAPGTSLLVATSPFFFVRRERLARLARRRRIASIYDNMEYPQAGGLMSYGANLETLWEQAGASVARLLKGESPADLPVAQAAKFELVVNARTARELGLTIPPSLLARADEVIE